MPNFNWALQYCVTVNALISACHSEREMKRQRRSQYIDCHIIILMARIVEYLPPYTCAPSCTLLALLFITDHAGTHETFLISFDMFSSNQIINYPTHIVKSRRIYLQMLNLKEL